MFKLFEYLIFLTCVHSSLLYTSKKSSIDVQYKFPFPFHIKFNLSCNLTFMGTYLQLKLILQSLSSNLQTNETQICIDNISMAYSIHMTRRTNNNKPIIVMRKLTTSIPTTPRQHWQIISADNANREGHGIKPIGPISANWAPRLRDPALAVSTLGCSRTHNNTLQVLQCFTCGVGTAYPSGAPEFPPRLFLLLVLQFSV